MARVTYFYREMSEYIQIDLDLLRERHEVTVVECRSRWPRPLALLRLVRSSDVVMSWFASWHSLFPAILCRLLGRPMVLSVGGYDTATGAASGYGAARGWFKRLVTRVTVRLATRLVVVSEFAWREALAAGADPARLVIGPHGLDPARYADPGMAREDLAVTVGGVNASNLERKGLEPFVRAAALLPGVRFVVIGAWLDGAVDRLRAIATPNVRFTGRVPHEEKVAWLWRARVVVQASRHEAFGLSLAEGMLCGAVPVVTAAGALPEVLGDAGVMIASPDPHAIADGVRRALDLGADGSRRARERVRTKFTIDQRRDLVHEWVAHALAGPDGRAGAALPTHRTWRRTAPLIQSLLRSVFRLMCVVGRPIGGIRPRRLYCWVARYAFPAPVHHWHRNQWGSELWLSPYYYLDRNIIALGSYDRTLHDFIERRVRPGSVCMDVGANLGEVTLHLATRVGRAGRVYAFEPVAAVHERLNGNVERNGAGDVVETFRVALSDRTGTGTIRHAGPLADNQGVGSLVTAHAGLTGSQEVPLLTLDEFVERHDIRRLDFMKIDIQGAEPLLLEGGRRTFATLAPDLLIEVAPQELRNAGRDSRDLCVMLEDLGYRLHRLNGRGIGSPIDARTVPPDFEANNVFCTKAPTGGRAGDARVSEKDARARRDRGSPGVPVRDRLRPDRAPTPPAAPHGAPAAPETTIGPSTKEGCHVAACL